MLNQTSLDNSLSNNQDIEQSKQQAENLTSGLEDLYGKLGEEEQQEKELEDETSSLLANVNPELLREREREYRDVEKHWIRKNVWLQIAKDIAQEKQKTRVGSQGLRYLTLPAYYRLDVSLLLRDGLIEVTQTNADGHIEEVYVAAFETEPGKFGRMVGQIPRFKLFGRTMIENALTDPKNDYYVQLRDLFPFDIVNLDLTTSLTPRHEGPYSRTMKAIEAVFDLQAGHGSSWALFLTFRNLPSDWEQNALEQLFTNLQNNLDTYPQVVEAFHKLYHESNVDGLAKRDLKKCISQAVTKWLVDRAHAHKFTAKSIKCYYYPRHNSGVPSYDIFKHALVFSSGEIYPAKIPTKGTPLQSWMSVDLVSCIEHHRCLDVEEKLLNLSYSGVPTILNDLKADVDQLCKLIS